VASLAIMLYGEPDTAAVPLVPALDRVTLPIQKVMRFFVAMTELIY